MGVKSSCPPDDLLSQFLDDRLAPGAEAELDVHVRACWPCQIRLERLTKPTINSSWADSPPSLPPQLSRRLEESLSGSLDNPEGEADSVEFPPEVPGYDVYEEIGRGGSGVVYRALHRQLNRPVALKVLHDRTNAALRERLRREAEALAAIHDPAIVEVYEIGEVEGKAFLALEYVASGCLSRFTAATPQLPEPSARLMARLAGAIQHAHQAGFIHRDLKPGNILLDKHFGVAETSGLDQYVPKISDFGVVKIVSSQEHLTQTREFLGTPSYMAPEQAYDTGSPIDERTDVYGLGAILYELLTGRPPFRSASPLDTLLQVKESDAVSPRRLEPNVPRDLETICLKCLEKDSGRRYPTARALQQDLERYLEGRPVVARPLSRLARTWRWCRRNRGWAAAIALSVGVLFLAGVAGPVIALRERTLRKEAAHHEAAALSEKARAHEHLDIASKALEETISQVLLDARLQESGLEDVRSGILRTAVPYLEQFVRREESDRLLRIRQARALLQLAGLHAKNRDYPRARAAYQQALAIFSAVKEPDDPLLIQAGLASAHMEFGRFLFISERDLAAAKQHLRKALSIEERLFGSKPVDEKSKDRRAITLSLLGHVLGEEETTRDEARSMLIRALALREELLQSNPEREHYIHYAALTHLNLALFLRQNNDLKAALPHYEQARALERKVLSTGELTLEGPITLSMIEGDYATALAELGEIEPAWEHLNAAISTADALARTYPSVVKYIHNAKRWHDAALVLANQAGDSGEARARCEAAVNAFKRLTEAADASPAAVECWLAARLNLGEQLSRTGKLNEAATERGATGTVLRPWLERRETGPLSAETLVALSLRHARLLEQAPDVAEALDWYQRSVSFLETPPQPTLASLLSHAYMGCSRCYTKLGKATEADAAAQAAQATLQKSSPTSK
jgi:serine/threonine protein kinase/tetratricopeptide (TPR) repeat protein